MHPIISNNTVVNAVIGEYPNIRQWMVSGISQMSTDTTKYHTVQHVKTMLEVLDAEHKNPANQKFFREEITILGLAEVLVAICWHDVVYIPGHPYNELESAAKWELYAQRAGDVPLHFVNDVSDMINSTKIGFDTTWIQDHPTVALLHDLDYISFASYAVMVMNRSSLRNEFASISDKNYTKGRLKFLKTLMNSVSTTGLFLTPVFNKYNELAMENITREYNLYKHAASVGTDTDDTAPITSYIEQQHEDITLDFFMRLCLILNDWEPEQRLEAFDNLTQLITERIHAQGQVLQDYPSVERVISLIQHTLEEQRDAILIQQIAAAIERVETYQSLMDTKDDEYIIIGEEDDEADC